MPSFLQATLELCSNLLTRADLCDARLSSQFEHCFDSLLQFLLFQPLDDSVCT